MTVVYIYMYVCILLHVYTCSLYLITHNIYNIYIYISEELPDEMMSFKLSDRWAPTGPFYRVLCTGHQGTKCRTRDPVSTLVRKITCVTSKWRAFNDPKSF